MQLFIQVKKGIEQLIVLLQSAHPESSSRLGALKYQINFLPLLHLVELLILLHLVEQFDQDSVHL